MAGFVVGGVMWAVASGTDGDADVLQDDLAARTGRPRESACFGQSAPDVLTDCDELTNMRDSADRQRAGAIAGFVIGGVFAAASVGLLVAHFMVSPSEDEAAVVVAPLSGGASVHFVRRW